MANKRGNPAFVKGRSGNPTGRPRGGTTLLAYRQNPDIFFIHHIRWERFCWGLLEPPYTGAAAARRAGYSPKSARFIASRLIKKPVIREKLRRIHERINASYKISEGIWAIPDESGEYHIYRRK